MPNLTESFENVRRSALVLHPKEPFMDWIKRVEPGIQLQEPNLEGDVYLLPDFEEQEDMRRWLSKKYDLLFSDQLTNWFANESVWPQKRTFSMFQDWFSFSFHTMVWDTLESPLDKD